MKKLKENELIEQPLFEDIQIMTEAVDGAVNPYKLLTIGGTASKGGYVNRNGRIYPTSVLNKAVEKAQTAITKGKLLGEVDHPEYSGSLSKAAVKFTKLWMEGDNMLFEGDVLATDDGRRLELLLRSGVGVGISTRGYGSVRPIDNTDGTIYEVQPDYELKGIDCVLEESNEYGKVANFESLEGGKVMDLEKMKAEYPELFKQIEEEASAKAVEGMKESLEKDFEQKVAQAIEDKKEAFMAEAKKEVMESEEIATLKTVVEGIVAAVKPLMPEAKTKEELDAELVQTNESLKAELETVKGVVAVLEDEKKKAEALIEAEEKAKKVVAKIDEKVKGHRFEKALRERLANCESEEAVEKQFESEVSFIASLVENAGAPAGTGKVKEEEKPELSEEVERQRKLAGIKEGGK